jgi:hypothetical protein
MFDPTSDAFKAHIAEHASAAKKIIGRSAGTPQAKQFAIDHDLNCDDKVDAHTLRALCNNYNNNNVLSIRISIDHDGADQYGWQSNLYTMIVRYKENDEVYDCEWYREEWFDGHVQYYEKSDHIKLVKDESKVF